MSELRLLLALLGGVCVLANLSAAESTAPPLSSAATTVRPNTAVVPAPPSHLKWRERAEVVLRRAADHSGGCDIVFLGDSITEFWESSGTDVWQRYYGRRKCLNLGVSGDRTQCLLWRFERGQLAGLKPKLIVLMIGTNNCNNDDNTEAELVAGVQAVITQLRKHLPESKILLLGIFPRGETFSPQRGKIAQVNQALARLGGTNHVYYLDIGSQLMERDGSISRAVMPDYLHLSERGYELWAEAMEPEVKRLLGD
jgi:lysophospholipase L1-like esterase